MTNQTNNQICALGSYNVLFGKALRASNPDLWSRISISECAKKLKIKYRHVWRCHDWRIRAIEERKLAQMLRCCSERGDIKYVIVDHVERFAQDRAQLKERIRKFAVLGVQVIFASGYINGNRSMKLDTIMRDILGATYEK